MPFMTYQFLPGGPESRYGTDQSLAQVELVFLCKVTTEGQDQTVTLGLANIMDTLLQSVRQYSQGDWVLDCYRRDLAYQPIFRDSKHYRQAGGRYVVIARPAI